MKISPFEFRQYSWKLFFVVSFEINKMVTIDECELRRKKIVFLSYGFFLHILLMIYCYYYILNFLREQTMHRNIKDRNIQYMRIWAANQFRFSNTLLIYSFTYNKGIDIFPLVYCSHVIELLNCLH